MTGKKNKAGRPPKGPTETVYARVPPDLAAALDAYLLSLRPSPTTTGVVITALEDFLQAKGFWPRPARAPKPPAAED